MENFIAFLRYGDEFRLTRRYMSQYFNSREHVHLYPLLADQVLILLKNLLDSPEEFESHLDRLVSLSHHVPVCTLIKWDKERPQEQS